MAPIFKFFGNSVIVTCCATVLNVLVFAMAGYAFARFRFPCDKLLYMLLSLSLVIPMTALLQPVYSVVNNLGLYDTKAGLILVNTALNMPMSLLILRGAFQSIPKAIEEAAYIDGAGFLRTFFQIMMPVCKPIIAVLALWSFVGMWNSYFDAMIYLNDANLQPLQLVLRSILVQNTPQPGMIADIQSTAEMAKVAEQLKYATIVVSSLPLLIMYPFFQKYFDKGIMVGSVKG